VAPVTAVNAPRREGSEPEPRARSWRPAYV